MSRVLLIVFVARVFQMVRYPRTRSYTSLRWWRPVLWCTLLLQCSTFLLLYSQSGSFSSMSTTGMRGKPQYIKYNYHTKPSSQQQINSYCQCEQFTVSIPLKLSFFRSSHHHHQQQQQHQHRHHHHHHHHQHHHHHHHHVFSTSVLFHFIMFILGVNKCLIKSVSHSSAPL